MSTRSPYDVHERVENLLRGVAALDERDHVAVHRRRHLTAKSRSCGTCRRRACNRTGSECDARARRARPASSTARAGLRRQANRARRALIHREQVRRVRDAARVPGSCAADATRTTAASRGRSPTAAIPRPITRLPPRLPLPTAGTQAASRTRDCAARSACGHITMMPPMCHEDAADPDPDDERIERDAHLRRLVAHAGEHDVRVELRVVRIPTSVDGSKVGRPCVSKYCASRS